MNRFIPAQEPLIRVHGRTVLADPLPLFWSASGIEFITDGSEVTLELEADHEQYEQWIRVELDGATMIRMPLNRGMQRVTVFRSCAVGTLRRVRLFKEVQAMSADDRALLLVHAVETDGALHPLPEPSCRIEFVGDSITSGEGLAGGHDFMDWVSAMFSTRYSYTQTVAAALDAEVRLISQSGWGACCSWDNNPDFAMPRVYDRVCGPLSGQRNGELGADRPNDFSAWQPDVVVVNLCTNDDSSFFNGTFTEKDGVRFQQTTGPDGRYEPASAARLDRSVRDFLGQLRRLNPNAYLLWVYGMYESHNPGEMWELLEKAISTYRDESGDDRCGTLHLTPIQQDWFGSRGHPGKPSHDSAAELLIPRLRQILGR